MHGSAYFYMEGNRADMRLYDAKVLGNNDKFVFSDTQRLLRRDVAGKK